MLCFLIYFFTVCVKLLWNTDVFLQSLALTLNKSFQKSSHTYYQTKLVVNSNTCSFLPDKNYYLYRITRSILICITFALFSFQVPFLFLRTDFSNQFLDYSNLLLEVHFSVLFEQRPDISYFQDVRSWFFSFCLLFLFSKEKVSGGHKWTRTIDLTLIRRAL